MFLPSTGRFAMAAIHLVSAPFRPISTSSSVFKGHSKWQNIKHVKGKNDLIKSQATNQLLKKVNSAVRKGGFDLKINRELAGLEQEFRAQGLPLDTFKNYLQKMKDRPEQPFRFEVIGPAGSFFIIDTEAPNRSSIANAIGKYMNKLGGFRLAADPAGVLTWFDAKGVVRVDSVGKDGKVIPFEKTEEMGIELDCEQVDIVDGDDGRPRYEMLCDPKQVNYVEEGMAKQGMIIESAEAEMRPKHPIALSEGDTKLVEKFYEFLQEDENVRQIYDNIQPDE